MKGIVVNCPWCGREVKLPFLPSETLNVTVSKRCGHCRKLFRVEVKGSEVMTGKK